MVGLYAFRGISCLSVFLRRALSQTGRYCVRLSAENRALISRLRLAVNGRSSLGFLPFQGTDPVDRRTTEPVRRSGPRHPTVQTPEQICFSVWWRDNQ